LYQCDRVFLGLSLKNVLHKPPLTPSDGSHEYKTNSA
jgi:hypothetical protein